MLSLSNPILILLLPDIYLADGSSTPILILRTAHFGTAVNHLRRHSVKQTPLLLYRANSC